jgi:hypothetical protein
MVDARTVAVVLDVIMRAVEALSERSCNHLRRLVFWNRIRRRVDEVSRDLDDGIWIVLLLRLYRGMKSKCGETGVPLLE